MSFLGDILGPIASVIGIGSGISTMAGNKNTYVPKGLGQADQQFQDMLTQLVQSVQAQGGQLTPELQQAFQQYLNVDPSGMTAAANRAGDLYGGLVGDAQQAQQFMGQQAGVTAGAQQNLLNAGNQLYQTSLDPQNALRQQLQQQITDASRAGTSSRGIGMSGEAAGIENKAVTDFLMNWQNQQLQRQATGVQGLSGASNAAATQNAQTGQNVQAGLGFGQAAPAFAQAAGQTPYDAQIAAAQQPFNAANQYSGALNQGVNQPFAASMAQIIPYLNAGTGASNQAFNQNQIGLNNLSTGLGQLAKSPWLQNIFSSQSPGSGSSDAPNAYDQGNAFYPYGGGP